MPLPHHFSLCCSVQTFDAALDSGLRHPGWQRWADEILPAYEYPPDNVQQVVAAFTVWREAARKMKQDKEEQRKREQQQHDMVAATEGGGLHSWVQQHQPGLLKAAGAAVLGGLGWLLLKAWKSRPPL